VYLSARRAAWERGLSLLQEPTGGQRLLDVGSNYGHFLLEAERRGWQAHGVEEGRLVREQAVAGAASRLYGTLAQAGDHAPYAAITLWDVLEHIVRPVPFLRELRDLLAEDGRFLVRVPDAHAFGIAGATYLKLCHPANPEEHPHHYTPQSLGLTARAAGLRIIATIPAAAGERVAAGRGVLDEAVRGLIHRRSGAVPYEFTAVLAR
jgi:SAM-dependent methyltransferase